MSSIYQIKSFVAPIEIKDVDAGSKTIIQAYTKYNVVDADGDIGRKGMFTKTWSDNFSRIKWLQNHDVTKPLGKIEELYDDNDYAYFKAGVGSHFLGTDFIKMAESGLITEASYGYQTKRQNKTAEGNELLEVKLWEVSSLTHWGSNQHTQIVSLSKSLTKEEQVDKISNRIKSLEKFCRNTTATDETIELLLLEIKQLQQLFVDLNTSTYAADEAPTPEVKESTPDYSVAVNAIKHYLNKQ